VLKDPAMRSLAGKVNYLVDPLNPYPNQFTGHLRVTLNNGEVFEHRQAYIKGGAEHPLSDHDILRKFQANCIYGGLPVMQSQALEKPLARVLDLTACPGSIFPFEFFFRRLFPSNLLIDVRLGSHCRLQPRRSTRCSTRRWSKSGY
jgi:MmgE/PrpD C-terminal domain